MRLCSIKIEMQITTSSVTAWQALRISCSPVREALAV